MNPELFIHSNESSIERVVFDCEFAYQCPLHWTSLTPTQDPDIRFCSSCSQLVYFAHNQSEIDEFRKTGQCVAIANRKDTVIPRLMGILPPPDLHGSSLDPSQNKLQRSPKIPWYQRWFNVIWQR